MNHASASPVLNRLQHAWLAELGLDARMLGRYALVENVNPDDKPGPAAAVENTVVQESGAPVAAAVQRPATLTATVSIDAPNVATARKGPSPLASMRTALLAGKPIRKAEPDPVPDSSPPGATSFDSPIVDVSGALDMDSLRVMISSCQGCSLHENRSHVVFGSGDIQRPRLLIVGEMPGDHDDRVGEPFQGPTGKLLHAMLAAVGVDPAGSVFYTNIVKCRPLGSRPAQAVEILSCQPYLARQINLLQPECVLALGRMAALALLGGDETLDALRGRVHQFSTAQGQSIRLVATHHPTSLLLRARSKAEVWADLNLMRKALNGTP
jgi:uracil-DNA glycosylase family 4